MQDIEAQTHVVAEHTARGTPITGTNQLRLENPDAKTGTIQVSVIELITIEYIV